MNMKDPHKLGYIILIHTHKNNANKVKCAQKPNITYIF